MTFGYEDVRGLFVSDEPCVWVLHGCLQESERQRFLELVLPLSLKAMYSEHPIMRAFAQLSMKLLARLCDYSFPFHLCCLFSSAGMLLFFRAFLSLISLTFPAHVFVRFSLSLSLSCDYDCQPHASL